MGIVDAFFLKNPKEYFMAFGTIRFFELFFSQKIRSSKVVSTIVTLFTIK
jgi:hypothetical protein